VYYCKTLVRELDPDGWRSTASSLRSLTFERQPSEHTKV
jgi:hypothetical protein